MCFLNDMSAEAIDRAMKNIAWSVDKFIQKGRFVRESGDDHGSYHTGSGLFCRFAGGTWPSRPFSKKIELKREIFKDLDKTCRPQTMIASNTSAIPITELAAMTLRPEKSSRNSFFQPGAHDAGSGGHQGDCHQ